MLKRERLRILLETCTVFTISTQTKSSTMCHGVKYTQKIGEEIIYHLTECKIVVYVLTLVDNIIDSIYYVPSTNNNNNKNNMYKDNALLYKIVCSIYYL